MYTTVVVAVLVAVAVIAGACGGSALDDGDQTLGSVQDTRLVRPVPELPAAEIDLAVPEPTTQDCGQAEPMEKGDPLIAANNEFAFDLLHELAEERPGENIFFSPLSVSLALMMTYNGAAGGTRDAMAETLGVGAMSRDEVNLAAAGLLRSLCEFNPEVALDIANSLWARRGVSFKDDFLHRNLDFYGARTEALDFDDPASLDIINGWVSDATMGKIDAIIDEITPEQVLFLINAIYFYGTWLDEFKLENTIDRAFHLESGTTKDHPMMARSGRYRYVEDAGFQAAKLPYVKDEIGMYVFVPSDSTLVAFLDALNGERFDDMIARFSRRDGEVVIPRFKMEYEAKLNDALTRLGMGVAFGDADFSDMGDLGLFIDYVKHKAIVEVNEEGTEAAAVTAVAMASALSIGQPPPFRLVADRPFFFAIRDDSTGTLLFAGVLYEPFE